MKTNKKKSNKFKLGYCVVSENYVAKILKATGNVSHLTLMLGTLVHVHSCIDNDNVAVKVVNCEPAYDTVDENNLWICPASCLLPVNDVLWPLVNAIVSPIERVDLLKQKSLCEQLCTIQVGTLVKFISSDGNKTGEPAVVKYKGPIPKMGPGIYFGIELLECQSRENHNGCFAGQRYFSCPEGTGKFVTVNELRLVHSTTPLAPKNSAPVISPSLLSSDSASDTYKSTAVLQLGENLEMSHVLSSDSTLSKNSVSDDDAPLKKGDRVVWISDAGPVSGVVRWFIWHDKGQLKVGVSLEDITAKGENGESTVLEIPALELVKADDFYGNSLENKKNKSCSKNESEQNNSREGCKLRRSDSFRWNKPSCIQSNSDRSEDVVDFLTGDRQNQSNAVTVNGKSVKMNNVQHDLINISSSPPNCDSDDVMLIGSNSSDGSSYYDTPERIIPGSQDSSLGIGSMVEVQVKGEPYYGVIRWIGVILGDVAPRKVAGIEMEEEHVWCSDGTFNGRRYFQCNPQRAFFVNLNQCRKDSRFQETRANLTEPKAEDFGGLDSPIIPGVIQPVYRDRDMFIEDICGKYKGIQGHHNSCYLDATLFSMFMFTSVFDSLLYRPPREGDIADYEEVQRVLREEIVNPLREKYYVRADRVMKLRTLMEKLSSVSGLTSEEKDPEEFLTSLVAQILKAEPFLKLSSGQEAYHYQLFVEKDEQLALPTVQQLFEQSFLTSDIKLKEVPSCLIIQMPRFGKNFKMYPRILPSLLLDVTDVIEDSPRQCTVCGKLAEYECKQCFNQCDEGLQSISFCAHCLDTVHSHQKRSKHVWKQLRVPDEFTILQDHCVIPRLFMELFAVVCIETSHYVAFVKCGTGSDAPWCFFDSMADRKGEQNGYNIPEMVSCPELPYWLSERGVQKVKKITDDRALPEYVKRLYSDAYMCMYRSSEVMMYR